MRELEFDFEKLEVYKWGMEFVDEAFKMTEGFNQRIQFSLGDQFRRAALSICNNIAEGAGKKTHNAKIQMYGYALDSARECIPMITLSLKRQYIDESEYDALRGQIISICNMLAKLMQSVRRTQPLTLHLSP